MKSLFSRTHAIARFILLFVFFVMFFGVTNREASAQTACSGIPWSSCPGKEGTVKFCGGCEQGYKAWVCEKVEGWDDELKKIVIKDYRWKPYGESCSSCPWPLTNGQCCPTGDDACTEIGKKQCIEDPFLSECKPWSSVCSTGYWAAICNWPNTEAGVTACRAAEEQQTCNPANQPPSNPVEPGEPGNPGNPGNPSTPVPTPKPYCGQECSVDSDCTSATPGVQLACKALGDGKKVCVNINCPSSTTPGANCSCDAKVQKCGELCGGSMPLCAEGSQCTFVTGGGYGALKDSCQNINASQYPGTPTGTSGFCVGRGPGAPYMGTFNASYKVERCYTYPAGSTPNGSGGTNWWLYKVDEFGKVVKDGKLVGGLFTKEEIAQTCYGCGNGIKETGEECDNGPDNGKPGSDCDAFCKPRAPGYCNSSCTKDTDCQYHQVKLVNVAGTTGKTMVIDAIEETSMKGQLVVEETSTSFVYSGTWTAGSASIASGGKYKSNSVPGQSVTFLTNAQSIRLKSLKYTGRSSIDVYVDGKKVKTIPDIELTSSLLQPYTSESIAIGTENLTGYYCRKEVGATTGLCRLNSFPDSPICAGNTPIPTPTPGSLVCDLTPSWTSTGNVNAWKYGDSITMILSKVPTTRIPTGGKVRYEGEGRVYRGSTMIEEFKLVPNANTASQFVPFKVKYGNSSYVFRFRYCVINASNVETCTGWGPWLTPGASATPMSCATPPVCPPGSTLITGEPKDGGCPRYQCLPSSTPTTGTTIKLVNRISGTRTSMVIDGFTEDGTFTAETAPMFAYTGTWKTGTDSSPNGGSYKHTAVNGSSVSFTTTASSISVRTYRHTSRSIIDVYVNGKLVKSITDLNTGSGWVNIPLSVAATIMPTSIPTSMPTSNPTKPPSPIVCGRSCSAASDCGSGYTCYQQTSGVKVCRLSVCPTNTFCNCIQN